MPVITSFDAYEKCVDSVFHLAAPGRLEMPLTLVEASKKHDDETQLSFSLIFQGPGEVLPQGSYTLRHEQMNEIELFLVPVRAKKGIGFQYEAVFNLLKEETNAEDSASPPA